MAIEFDGVDDFLNCGTGDFLTNNSAVSIYFKFKINNLSTAAADRLIHRNDTPQSGDGFEVAIDNNGAIEFDVRGDSYVDRLTNNSTITAGNEYVLIVTWDGSVTATNVHIYVNGSEASYQFTQNGSNLYSLSTSTTYIGKITAGTSDRFFDGIMREVAVFNNVISSTSISLLSNSKIRNTPLRISGCVRYWRMDDQADDSSADGDTVTDLTGNGNATGDDGANNTGLLWRREANLVYSNAFQRRDSRGVLRGVSRT